MLAKSEIIKIHLENVAFLTTRNRLVRETIGIVMRAQRRKIEEIGFKYECLKFIWKMCYFEQPGAETIVFVTYFDQLHARANLQQQKFQIGP